MKNKGLFLRISILLVGILFFYKNSTAQCSNYNVSLSQTYDGPYKNDAEISPAISGGSGSTFYSWYKSGSYIGVGIILNYIDAGLYKVVVVDSIYGCTDSAYITAVDTGSFNCNNLYTYSYKSSDNCNVLNDAQYAINLYGGSGNYSYAWSHTSQNASTVSFPSNGKYYVTISDITNNCSKIDTIDVIDCNSINCQGLNVNLSKLSDGNSTNDVQIKAVASGGSGVYTYTWNNYQYWGSTISNATTGIYIVRVLDSISSCVIFDTIYVTDTSYNPCANTFTATFTKLADGPSINDVSVKVVFNGGTAPYTYYWNKGNNSYMNTTVTNVGAGIIEFYIYDTLGCSKTFQYNVVDTFDSTNICNGFEGFIYKDDSCGLNDIKLYTNVMYGSQNYSYKWNTADSSNYISSRTTGTYSVIITDLVKGCKDTVTISVVDSTCIVDPCANFYANIYYYDSCGNNDIKLVAKSTNHDSVKFEWSTGSKASELYNMPSGTYWVAAWDSINNCRDTAYITAIDSNKKCCHAGFYTNDYFINASKTLYNYSSSNYSSLKSQLWSFGDGATATTYNANHTYTNAGNYTVCLYIEDSIGCKDTFCDILTAPAPGKNLKVTHYQGWPNNNYVPGQSKDIFIMYENVGTTTENVFVEYYFPTGMVFANSYPAPFSILSDRLVFKKDNFQPGMSGYIDITMISPPTFTFGQYKCDETKILSMTNDIDVSNNVSSLCDSVKSSHDPNDKTSYPSGIGEEGITDPNTKELSYLIRFQNEGNWRTYTVRVEDEIDPSLDINSLKLGDISHDFRLVKNGRKLTWYFDNIHLTPKSEDEAKSSGFISYSMKLNPGLPLGTKIKNTAYIYFDYNEAIITNTKVNTLKSSSSIQSAALNDENNFIVSRMNSGEIQIKALANIQNVSIYNIQGAKLFEQAANQKSITIDNASLSQGVYIINVVIGENTISKKVKL